MVAFMGSSEQTPAKTRLMRNEQFLYSLSPKIFDFFDRLFNIPRYLDRCYLTGLFGEHYSQALDIGAGKGSMTKFLLNYADEITCLDKEEKELAVLKRRFKNEVARLSFVTADAVDLPFADKSFDLIFSNCVLEHIKNDEKVLAELGRCLRKGGALVMALPNKEMQAGWFKSLLFKYPRLRFLADPNLSRYFSFANIKEAEEWYALNRWQHIRRGYSLAEIKERLAKYNLKVESFLYFPSPLLSEPWEIVTFSQLNRLFPYLLSLMAPIFWLLPKGVGKKESSLEFAVLARKR